MLRRYVGTAHPLVRAVHHRSARTSAESGALRLSGAGSLIVVTSPDVVGSRAMIELIGSHPRLIGTALQTVGSKGRDGFAMARVLA